MDQKNRISVNEKSQRDMQERPVEATVVSLHVAPATDVPMTALPLVQVVPGRGMVGDRYYLRRGRDAAYNQMTCDVTLVEQETIEAMRQREPSIDPGESARRNIVVQGCTLSQLAGRTFRIGAVTLRGLERRDSEDAPSESVQQAALPESTAQAAHCLLLPRPDLRAMVLTEGTISVGDRIELI